MSSAAFNKGGKFNNGYGGKNNNKNGGNGFQNGGNMRGLGSNASGAWTQSGGGYQNGGNTFDRDAGGQGTHFNPDGPSMPKPPTMDMTGGPLEHLGKRMEQMQSGFSEALSAATGKESEKFDLIFSILSELQSRQASLEQSFKQLKQAYANQGINVGGMQSGPGAQNNLASPGMQNNLQGMGGNPMQQQMLMSQDGSMGFQQMNPMMGDGCNGGFLANPNQMVLLPGGQMQYMQMQQMNSGQGGQSSMNPMMGGNSEMMANGMGMNGGMGFQMNGAAQSFDPTQNMQSMQNSNGNMQMQSGGMQGNNMQSNGMPSSMINPNFGWSANGQQSQQQGNGNGMMMMENGGAMVNGDAASSGGSPAHGGSVKAESEVRRDRVVTGGSEAFDGPANEMVMGPMSPQPPNMLPAPAAVEDLPGAAPVLALPDESGAPVDESEQPTA